MEKYFVSQSMLDYAAIFFGSIVLLTIGVLLGMSLVYLLRRPRRLYRLISE